MHGCLVAQLCLTLCDPMDCSPPGSFVHGILQAWILEWDAISSSRGFSPPRDGAQVSYIAGGFFTVWAIREALNKLGNFQKLNYAFPKIFQIFLKPTWVSFYNQENMLLCQSLSFWVVNTFWRSHRFILWHFQDGRVKSEVMAGSIREKGTD